MRPGFALSPSLSGLSHVGIGSTELPKLKQEGSKNNKKGLFYQRFVTNLKSAVTSVVQCFVRHHCKINSNSFSGACVKEECELNAHGTDGTTSRRPNHIPCVRRLVLMRLESNDLEMEDDRGKPIQLQIIVCKRQVPATAFFFTRVTMTGSPNCK